MSRDNFVPYGPSIKMLDDMTNFERLQRRKMRLIQVRKQAESNALSIRLVHKQKKECICNAIAADLQKKSILSLKSKLERKLDEFKVALCDSGQGHKLANDWEDPNITMQMTNCHSQYVSKKRFATAIQTLHDEQKQKTAAVDLHKCRLQFVRGVENDRAALITSLPIRETDRELPTALNIPPSILVCNSGGQGMSYTHKATHSSVTITNELDNCARIEPLLPSQNAAAIDSITIPICQTAATAAVAEEKHSIAMGQAQNLRAIEETVKADVRGQHAIRRERVRQHYCTLLNRLKYVERNETACMRHQVGSSLSGPPAGNENDGNVISHRLEKAFEEEVLIQLAGSCRSNMADSALSSNENQFGKGVDHEETVIKGPRQDVKPPLWEKLDEYEAEACHPPAQNLEDSTLVDSSKTIQPSGDWKPPRDSEAGRAPGERPPLRPLGQRHLYRFQPNNYSESPVINSHLATPLNPGDDSVPSVHDSDACSIHDAFSRQQQALDEELMAIDDRLARLRLDLSYPLKEDCVEAGCREPVQQASLTPRDSCLIEGASQRDKFATATDTVPLKETVPIAVQPDDEHAPNVPLLHSDMNVAPLERADSLPIVYAVPPARLPSLSPSHMLRLFELIHDQQQELGPPNNAEDSGEKADGVAIRVVSDDRFHRSSLDSIADLIMKSVDEKTQSGSSCDEKSSDSDAISSVRPKLSKERQMALPTVSLSNVTISKTTEMTASKSDEPILSRIGNSYWASDWSESSPSNQCPRLAPILSLIPTGEVTQGMNLGNTARELAETAVAEAIVEVSHKADCDSQSMTTAVVSPPPARSNNALVQEASDQNALSSYQTETGSAQVCTTLGTATLDSSGGTLQDDSRRAELRELLMSSLFSLLRSGCLESNDSSLVGEDTGRTVERTRLLLSLSGSATSVVSTNQLLINHLLASSSLQMLLSNQGTSQDFDSLSRLLSSSNTRSDRGSFPFSGTLGDTRLTSGDEVSECKNQTSPTSPSPNVTVLSRDGAANLLQKDGSNAQTTCTNESNTQPGDGFDSNPQDCRVATSSIQALKNQILEKYVKVNKDWLLGLVGTRHKSSSCTSLLSSNSRLSSAVQFYSLSPASSASVSSPPSSLSSSKEAHSHLLADKSADVRSMLSAPQGGNPLTLAYCPLPRLVEASMEEEQGEATPSEKNAHFRPQGAFTPVDLLSMQTGLTSFQTPCSSSWTTATNTENSPDIPLSRYSTSNSNLGLTPTAATEPTWEDSPCNTTLHRLRSNLPATPPQPTECDVVPCLGFLLTPASDESKPTSMGRVAMPSAVQPSRTVEPVRIQCPSTGLSITNASHILADHPQQMLNVTNSGPATILRNSTTVDSVGEWEADTDPWHVDGEAAQPLSPFTTVAARQLPSRLFPSLRPTSPVDEQTSHSEIKTRVTVDPVLHNPNSRSMPTIHIDRGSSDSETSHAFVQPHMCHPVYASCGHFYSPQSDFSGKKENEPSQSASLCSFQRHELSCCSVPHLMMMVDKCTHPPTQHVDAATSDSGTPEPGDDNLTVANEKRRVRIAVGKGNRRRRVSPDGKRSGPTCRSIEPEVSGKRVTSPVFVPFERSRKFYERYTQKPAKTSRPTSRTATASSPPPRDTPTHRRRSSEKVSTTTSTAHKTCAQLGGRVTTQSGPGLIRKVPVLQSHPVHHRTVWSNRRAQKPASFSQSVTAVAADSAIEASRAAAWQRAGSAMRRDGQRRCRMARRSARSPPGVNSVQASQRSRRPTNQTSMLPSQTFLQNDLFNKFVHWRSARLNTSPIMPPEPNLSGGEPQPPSLRQNALTAFSTSSSKMVTDCESIIPALPAGPTGLSHYSATNIQLPSNVTVSENIEWSAVTAEELTINELDDCETASLTLWSNKITVPTPDSRPTTPTPGRAHSDCPLHSEARTDNSIEFQPVPCDGLETGVAISALDVMARSYTSPVFYIPMHGLDSPGGDERIPVPDSLELSSVRGQPPNCSTPLPVQTLQVPGVAFSPACTVVSTDPAAREDLPTPASSASKAQLRPGRLSPTGSGRRKQNEVKRTRPDHQQSLRAEQARHNQLRVKEFDQLRRSRYLTRKKKAA